MRSAVGPTATRNAPILHHPEGGRRPSRRPSWKYRNRKALKTDDTAQSTHSRRRRVRSASARAVSRSNEAVSRRASIQSENQRWDQTARGTSTRTASRSGAQKAGSRRERSLIQVTEELSADRPVDLNGRLPCRLTARGQAAGPLTGWLEPLGFVAKWYQRSMEPRRGRGSFSRLLGGKRSSELGQVLIRETELKEVVSEVMIDGCFSAASVRPVNGDDMLVVAERR